MDKFIKAYDKLNEDLIEANKYYNGDASNRDLSFKMDELGFNAMFTDPFIALFLKDNGISVTSFAEYQMNSIEICKKIKELYKRLKQ